MKRSSINVDFRDEMKEIKKKLSDMGVRNLNIRKGYSNEYEFSFSLRCVDSKSEIIEILESCGAKNITISDSFSGARFDYGIDDKVDDREIKRLMQDKLRRKNYHSR